MFHQQDKMVSSYLLSFREAGCPLFWISKFLLHAYLAPLKCQQNLVCREELPEMGLAPGGLMRQELYGDEHGIDAWDTSHCSRSFVHIVNSVDFFKITGCEPPGKPQTAQDYTNAGLPWFDYYGGDLIALEGAKELTELDSVASVKLKKGEGFLPDNDPVTPAVVKKLKRSMVREGVF